MPYTTQGYMTAADMADLADLHDWNAEDGNPNACADCQVDLDEHCADCEECDCRCGTSDEECEVKGCDIPEGYDECRRCGAEVDEDDGPTWTPGEYDPTGLLRSQE